MPKSGTPGDDTIIATDPSTMVNPDYESPSTASPKSSSRSKPKRKNTWRTKEASFDASEDGGHVPETDVLEVWFSGCHCGASIIQCVRIDRY